MPQAEVLEIWQNRIIPSSSHTWQNRYANIQYKKKIYKNIKVGNKQMEKIFSKSFNGIHGLQYLYMNGNDMIKWPLIEDSFFYIFHKATELRHLVLESNNITFKGK